ncbi:phage tail tube protein [Roseovarius sp. B08]|uniref:phage tail tube protein n=1 Tax=Roseovarius sp. B08 TaxID=3449223 RepID=UPI003EDB8A29
MSDGMIGFGTELHRSSDSGATYNDTGMEVKEISPPNMSKDTVDVTHMKSPNRFREFIASLRDGGEFSLVVNYVTGDDTGIADLMADFASDDAGYYKIVFPDTTEWEFRAHVTEPEFGVPLEEEIEVTFTGKVTGEPVLTLAAAA